MLGQTSEASFHVKKYSVFEVQSTSSPELNSVEFI
jgi:hypothetical protein